GLMLPPAIWLELTSAQPLAGAGVGPTDVVQDLLQLVGIAAGAKLRFRLPGRYLLRTHERRAGDTQATGKERHASHGARRIIRAEIDRVNDFALQIQVLYGKKQALCLHAESVRRNSLGPKTPAPLSHWHRFFRGTNPPLAHLTGSADDYAQMWKNPGSETAILHSQEEHKLTLNS